MDLSFYFKVKEHVLLSGFSWEIKQVQEVLKKPCYSEDVFFKQYLWVVLNAGMRYQVAVQIYHRILYNLYQKEPITQSFNNKKKIEGILYVQKNLTKIFDEYLASNNKIDYLEKLPFIGPITKYHLARNLGQDICKPDRHLIRISKKYNQNPFDLCKNLSCLSGDPIGVVDIVVWRAANLGFI